MTEQLCVHGGYRDRCERCARLAFIGIVGSFVLTLGVWLTVMIVAWHWGRP